MLIWRYEEGYVVDSETGLVVDVIYDESPYPGNDEPKPYIGTHLGTEFEAKNTRRILSKLLKRSLKDERGTYVAYKLGLTNKSVLSLKKTNEVVVRIDDEELQGEFERWMKRISRNPRLNSRTRRVKRALALVMASRALGKDISVKQAARMFRVNEHHLRKLVSEFSKGLQG